MSRTTDSPTRPVFPSWHPTGRLTATSVLEVVRDAARQRVSGRLELRRANRWRAVTFHRGRVVFAATNDPDLRFGEMLLRRGEIKLEQLERALALLPTRRRIGTLLVECGALESSRLEELVRIQLHEIVSDTLRHDWDTWQFDDREPVELEGVALDASAAALIRDAIRAEGSLHRLERELAAPNAVWSLTEDAQEILAELGPPADVERLLRERLARGAARVDELCRDLLASGHETLLALLTLKVLGAVAADVSRGLGGTSATAGRLDSDWGCLELLVRLGRSKATGALHLRRGAHARVLSLRDGRCVHAQGDHPDDGLTADLLRRGSISWTDREEARGRLAASRSESEALVTLGALDPAEQRETVARHMLELVDDSCTWTDGGWDFSEREVGPFACEIDVRLAATIARGVRRVTSWTRVVRGCGGVDQPLKLHPSYLDVLDAMDAGVGEWDVIATLKTPSTPRRICRALRLGDFRVFQLLWALRLAGAIEFHDPDSTEPRHDDSAPPEAADPIESRSQSAPARGIPVVFEDAPRDASAISSATSGAAVQSPDGDPPRVQAADPAPPEILGTSPAPAVEATRPAWDPPGDLDEAIAHFNGVHRLVFRAVRAEVGAGAVNFFRSSRGRLAADPVGEATLQADGSWDSEALRRAAELLRIDDPWESYRELIEVELDLVRAHLGTAAAGELIRRIEDFGAGGASG